MPRNMPRPSSGRRSLPPPHGHDAAAVLVPVEQTRNRAARARRTRRWRRTRRRSAGSAWAAWAIRWPSACSRPDDVSIWNRTREKAEPLGKLGGKVVDKAADLAGVDVLFSMVSTGKDLR